MKLWCIMEGTGIESRINVCKKGFTRDNLLYGEHKGIKLVGFREADENDADFNKTFRDRNTGYQENSGLSHTMMRALLLVYRRVVYPAL